MRKIFSVPALVAVLAAGAVAGVLIGVRVGSARPPPDLESCLVVAEGICFSGSRVWVVAHGPHAPAPAPLPTLEAPTH